MKISEEVQDIIVDLFCNTKLSVTDLIALINTKQEITFEEFYKFLEDYENSHHRIICKKTKEGCPKFYNYLYELKKENKSIQDIVEILASKGIKADKKFIIKGINKAYQVENEKNLLKEKTNERNKKSIVRQNNQDNRYNKMYAYKDEIYSLRKKGYTYKMIHDYYKNKNVSTSYETIRKTYIKAYMEKGENMASYEHTKSFYKIPKSTLEEVIRMRDEGYPYSVILHYINKDKQKISRYKIEKYCEYYYKSKGQEEPKRKKTREILIPDSKLIELRGKGLSYTEIINYCNKNSVKVSYSYIAKRCQELNIKKQPKDKNVYASSIKDVMLKVAKNKHATQEQLKRFAKEVSKMYSIKLDVELPEMER